MRSRRSELPARVIAAIVLVTGVLLIDAGLSAQMATAERVELPGWWPTKRLADPAGFVGAARCAECHEGRTVTQLATAMARSIQPAPLAPSLGGGRSLAFDFEGLEFTIRNDGSHPTYSVSDGVRTSAVSPDWAFGAGNVGQTYLYKRDGVFHESRVSYFAGVDGLDFTPDRGLLEVVPPEQALGRALSASETARCFACHTTPTAVPTGLSPPGLLPGVTCEACHGPGRGHIEAMQLRGGQGPYALELAVSSLSSADSVDLCGACHATFWDVQLANEGGMAALRSQPYRLQRSRCWSGSRGDARLTCVSCHDPHRPLVTEPSAYDERCLACHAQPGNEPPSPPRARGCPVGIRDCTSCHMPKYEMPEMHHRFTDHLIRVVRRRDGG